MIDQALYPLHFDPIYEYRIWGGRRLGEILSTPLPGDGPIGEAWILSDRAGYESHVQSGPLKGKTLADLMAFSPEAILGNISAHFDRFPLLLKFIDAKQMLSVQVHPNDEQKDLLPPGEFGKTEAWVVLDAEPHSQIYAGLKPDQTPETLRVALAEGKIEDLLPGFKPEVGECLMIPAGTVHALGEGVMVFEVQQNSDTTFRLYDWNRVDAVTGKPRELHIEKSLAAINYSTGAVTPATPEPISADEEMLCSSRYFVMSRISETEDFKVGIAGEMRILVCIEGSGHIEYIGSSYNVTKGDVVLLPAVIGECEFSPNGKVCVLQIAVPEPI